MPYFNCQKFSVFLIALVAFCAHAAPIGSVISVKQGVIIERGGEKLPLLLKTKIELDDTIVSDETGKAQIIFNDDTTVTVSTNTRLSMKEFADTGDKPVFKAHIGKGLARIITGKIVEKNPDGFAISTPEATVGIRGTVLDIASQNGSTSVFVTNTLKQVFVNGALIPQGFKGIVSTPGATPSPQPITPQDKQQIDSQSTVASAGQKTTTTLSVLPAPMGPATSLADANLPKDSLSTAQTPLNAVVAGSLADSYSPTISSGSFGFTVNLASGAISAATMSYVNSANSSVWANASGGSGLFSGGSFSISGFTGSSNDSMTAGGIAPGTNMIGTGSVANVGDSVSGEWSIAGSGNSLTVGGGGTWGTGGFTGNRVQ